ncbi:MAG: hypothetical protein IT163_06290 [Bryobacterales bacterium]|nr:hypothetical protein [Bryobacterales bacterium]
MKVTTNGKRLNRYQIYRILANHNAISRLARDLGKNRTVVHLVLQGKRTSRAILLAAHDLAVELRANDGAADV